MGCRRRDVKQSIKRRLPKERGRGCTKGERKFIKGKSCQKDSFIEKYNYI